MSLLLAFETTSKYLYELCDNKFFRKLSLQVLIDRKREFRILGAAMLKLQAPDEVWTNGADRRLTLCPAAQLKRCALFGSRCLQHTHTDKHTHTHGPLSGTTQVSAGTRKEKTNLDFTEARESEWQWHMQVCTSLQTDNHASTPALKVFLQAGCPSSHPTNSVKALKATHLVNSCKLIPSLLICNLFHTAIVWHTLP